MVSDQLHTLRSVNVRLRDAHRDYTRQLAQVKNDPYMDNDRKRARLAQLAVNADAQIAAIKEEANAHAKAIRERASKRPPSNDVAKAQILRALDNGTDWRDIARLAVAQKDRALLTALREQLPWEAAAGKLEGGKKYAERAVKDASVLLDQLEQPLLDAREQRERQELAELDACFGSIESNTKKLAEHYQLAQQPQLLGHAAPVKDLYNWFGLPDADGKSNVGTTSFTMPVEDVVPGQDLLSQSLRAKGIPA